jgi:hypothetical protein
MRLASLVAVAGTFLYLVIVWIATPWVAGDTGFVMDGTNAFLTCLSIGDYSGCGYTGKLNYWGLSTNVGDWPLLQHVPDLISIGLGADGHPARQRILQLLSVVAVVAAVAVAWLVLTRAGRRAWFWAFIAILFSSPLLWYARTTAGETLATGLLVCFVGATLLPAHPVVVALAAIGAVWTKETSYPFVIALGVVGLLLAAQRTGVRVRPHFIWGAAGVAVGILAASLFNVVRYGKVISPNYFEEGLHTHGVARRLEYTLGVMVSPSGGMFVFWPSVCILVLAACVVGIAWRNRPGVDAWPALVILVVIAGLSIGFASWWTPFGWSAIGPRLALPWGLPLALLAIAAYGDTLRPLVARLLASPLRLLLVFAVLFAFTLPTIGTMWRPHETGRFFTQQQPMCDAPWRGGEEKWNRCQHEQMWFDRPMPLYGLDGLDSAGGAITAVVVAFGLLGALWLLRGELAAPRGARP